MLALHLQLHHEHPLGIAQAPGLAELPLQPEEDPFLLLESSLRAVQEVLLRRRCLPLQRSWIEQPYGEEELTLLEEEVLPVIQRTLLRVDAIDQELLAAQERLPVA